MDNTGLNLVPTGQMNSLEELATRFLGGQQTLPDTSPKFIMAGGKAMGIDESGQNAPEKLIGGLKSLATDYLMQQQIQKRNQFFKGINDVMSSPAPQEDKKNAVRQLIVQHGQDYGLGIKDQIMKDFGGTDEVPLVRVDDDGNPVQTGMVNKNARIVKAGRTSGGKLAPSLQKAKDTRADDLVSLVEDNNVKRDMISEAADALSRIDSGVYGKVRKGMLKNLSPDNPMLGDWQRIKMVLTDAQLLNTAKTKGAISDREMELFADAAANNDLVSSPAVRVVLDKLIKFLDSNETSKIRIYKKLYGEDPTEWEGFSSGVGKVTINTNVPKATATSSNQSMSGMVGVAKGRVKVKAPNGTVGSIPEGQLQDALAQGYKRI